MDIYSKDVTNLIKELSHLPGVGIKSAQRMAFHLINSPKENSTNLANAILNACNGVKYCQNCFTITDEDICPICAAGSRNHKQIMVVENERDLCAYEKCNEYEGVYHVLHGALSPLLNIGPEELKIKELLNRIKNENIEEIIIATNSSVEGEATAVYLSKLLKPLNIKVTRIASGVPVGGDIENVDEVTLSRAFRARVNM